MDGYTPLIFQIKDEDVERHVLNISNHFGYQEIDLVTGEENTETRAHYAKRKIAAMMIGISEQQEIKDLVDEIVVPPVDIIPE